jgi:hypothetical protein
MSTWTTLVALLGETSYVIDDKILAERVHQIALPYRDLPIMPSLAIACFGPMARTLGLTALVQGSVDEACDHLTHARRLNWRLQNQPMSVHIDINLAVALRHRTDRESHEQADHHLREATEAATRLGLDDLLRTLGDGSAIKGLVRSGRRPTPGVRNGALLRVKHGWRLVLDEEETVLPSHKGFHYLSYLLESPGKEFTALQLWDLVNSNAVDAIHQPIHQPAADTRARSEYQAELRRLTEQMRKASRAGDTERQAQLHAEYQEIEAQLKPQTIDNTAKQRSDAVTVALRRALRTIVDSNPTIGHALRADVTYGTRSSYSPPPPTSITWSIER